MTANIQHYEELGYRNSAMNSKDGQYVELQNVRLKDMQQDWNPGHSTVDTSIKNVYSETSEYESVNNCSSNFIDGVNFYETLKRNQGNQKGEHIYEDAKKHAQTFAANTKTETLKNSESLCKNYIRYIVVAGLLLLVAITAIILIILFVKQGWFINVSGSIHANNTKMESTTTKQNETTSFTTELQLGETTTVFHRNHTEQDIAMKFDMASLHNERFSSLNGSILSTTYTTDTPVKGTDSSLKYGGVQANRCLKQPTVIAWKVTFQYDIVTTLSGTNLVLEIGVSDLFEVQNNFFVGDNPRGWSFALARCGGDNNHVCIRAKHNNVLLLNKMYSENYSGFMKKDMFTVVLNLLDKTFSLYMGTFEKVYTFTNIRVRSYTYKCIYVQCLGFIHLAKKS